MGNKYRIRKKKKYNALTLLIVVFVFIVTISVGYSALSAELNINARVTLATGNNEFDIPPINEGGNEYVTPSIPPSDGTLESQILEDNKLTITYKITEKTGTPRSPVTTINFIDNSQYDITNITTSYTVTGNTAAIDGNVIISIPEVVSAGNSATVTITTPLKLNKLNTSVTVTCKIDYTVNGVQKSFYIEFIYYK